MLFLKPVVRTEFDIYINRCKFAYFVLGMWLNVKGPDLNNEYK